MLTKEPTIITIARELSQQSDDAFGRTVVLPSESRGAWRDLHVRPELLSENQDGERVYRLTPVQGRKIMAQWNQSLRVLWEAYHASRHT